MMPVPDINKAPKLRKILDVATNYQEAVEFLEVISTNDYKQIIIQMLNAPQKFQRNNNWKPLFLLESDGLTSIPSTATSVKSFPFSWASQLWPDLSTILAPKEVPRHLRKREHQDTSSIWKHSVKICPKFSEYVCDLDGPITQLNYLLNWFRT